MVPSSDTLGTLRAAALARRRDLPRAQRALRDDARHELLLASGLLEGVDTIAAYAAQPGEPDPLPWRHVAAGRTVLLPKVVGDDLSFHSVTDPLGMAAGSFGIREPVGGLPVPLADAHAVLVPLLAFDGHCHRVGRGRGFYDRALGTVPPGRRPLAIGVADDDDEVTELPQHSGDVRLDVVVTPTRMVRR